MIEFYETEKIEFENVKIYFLCDYNINWECYVNNLLRHLNKCFENFYQSLNKNDKTLQKECIVMAKGVVFKLYAFFEKLKNDLNTIVFSGLFYFPEFYEGYKCPDCLNKIMFSD